MTVMASLGCGGGGAAPATLVSPHAPAAGGGAKADGCLAVAGAKHRRSAGEPPRITAKHVLVKYVGAKQASVSVTRSREDACLRAQEARTKLEQGTSFADVVKEYSEEQGAATRDGTLGAVERGDVVPAFADAAFELRAGEVSQVVETDYGFHVILRAE